MSLCIPAKLFDAIRKNEGILPAAQLRVSARRTDTRLIDSYFKGTETHLGYIESNLLPDEEVIYKARLHWKIYWKSFLMILIGIGLFVLQPIVGGVVIFVGFILAFQEFVQYQTSEFGVTTKRVIIKVGLLRRRTLELLLRQVEAISVEQTVLGRMLGFGSVTLTGTGGVQEVFHNISAPLEFRKRIHGQAV